MHSKGPIYPLENNIKILFYQVPTATINTFTFFFLHDNDEANKKLSLGGYIKINEDYDFIHSKFICFSVAIVYFIIIISESCYLPRRREEIFLIWIAYAS
jgi:hypothetical protein